MYRAEQYPEQIRCVSFRKYLSAKLCYSGFVNVFSIVQQDNLSNVIGGVLRIFLNVPTEASFNRGGSTNPERTLLETLLNVPK